MIRPKQRNQGPQAELRGGISIPFWESDRVCLILGLFANYRSASETRGESFSETEGPSTTDGTSQTFTEGRSTSDGTVSTESIHQRACSAGRGGAGLRANRRSVPSDLSGFAACVGCRSGVTNVYDAALTVE